MFSLCEAEKNWGIGVFVCLDLTDVGACVLQVVWAGERLQRPSDGSARPQPGGSVQLLLAQVHNENRSHARRSGKTHFLS